MAKPYELVRAREPGEAGSHHRDTHGPNIVEAGLPHGASVKRQEGSHPTGNTVEQPGVRAPDVAGCRCWCGAFLQDRRGRTLPGVDN